MNDESFSVEVQNERQDKAPLWDRGGIETQRSPCKLTDSRETESSRKATETRLRPTSRNSGVRGAQARLALLLWLLP